MLTPRNPGKIWNFQGTDWKISLKSFKQVIFITWNPKTSFLVSMWNLGIYFLNAATPKIHKTIVSDFNIKALLIPWLGNNV